MKKTYGYIPLWFLLIVPPLLIFIFIFNFIQCGLAILCGAILLKIKDPFNNYYKRIMTAFILTIEADIICILFYALPELLYKIDFLNKNLPFLHQKKRQLKIHHNYLALLLLFE